MKISDANPSDVRYVAYRMRERDVGEFLAVRHADTHEALVEDMTALYGHNPAVIVASDEFPIAVGAVIETRPKVASLMFFATDEFPAIAMPLTRFIRQRLFPKLMERGVHRIEAVSIDGYVETHRWLRALGLDHEAIHQKFGKGGETYHTFAWTA